jgi:hypothetical protein
MPMSDLELNTRQATTRKAIFFGLSMLFWIPTIFFSLLLVYNTLPYFTFDPHMSFLEERAVLYAKAVWRFCFYFHIAAGAICISTALLQFSSWILRKRKKIHIVAGKVYVFVVLLVGAPTGFYMTFFAKGGYWERACFMLMAIFWFVSTYKGFVAAAREKNFLSHKFWMIRSYSMALTAVTFRIYHILFFLGGMGHFENYAISLWISVIGNALIAEGIIFFSSKNYMETLRLKNYGRTER